jgi:PadR family transcriptional regulator PadR
MTKRQSTLGEFEQLVLLAILQLEDEAYGPNISEELETKAGRRVSRGALYSSLDRLEQKGLLRWKIEAATSTRGGYPKRRFEVTRPGIAALREYRKALTNLWAGLEEVIG